MNVRYVSETAKTVTYEWNPPSGQQVVRLTRPDGTQTVFWSPTKDRHTFKVKQEGAYLVDCLGLVDAGAGEYPPVVDPPPPPPPPPSGQFGAKLRAQFTPLPASAPIAAENKTLNAVLKLQDGQRARKVVSAPGSHDGFWVQGDGAEIDLCSTSKLADTAGDEVQSIYVDGNRLQVYGFVSLDQGTDTKEHVLYIHGQNHLWAAVLGVRYHGYFWHAYGEGSSSTATNCTAAYSKARGPGVVWPGHTLTVRNSILAYNPDKGFRDSGGSWKVYDSCVWPKPTVALGNYVNCLFEDPLLDAQFRPQNPKCWTWADPGWIPAWDAYGNPYTRPCLGAVAA